jgi:probable phosphoglycerate mutase
VTVEVLFARHGNTFAPGDKVTWVGRDDDLPLVASGIAQAETLAAALKRLRFAPAAVYCAGLRRTSGYARRVAEGTGAPAPVVDRRLDEIAYGAWAGRSSEEIAADPKARALLDAWNARDAWPEGAGWLSTREEIENNARGFIGERLRRAGAPARVLVVGSNGILRFFPRLLAAKAPEPTPASFAMKTGRVGLIVLDGAKAALRYWNRDPAEL